MNAISSMNSLLSQYQSITTGSKSSSTSSTSNSTLLSETTETSSSSLLDLLSATDSSDSSSVISGVTSLFFDKTSSLAEFYNYATSLSSATSALSAATEDSSSLDYDDISDFVTAYNNLVSYAGENSDYISSSDLQAVKQKVSDATDSLSEIGITMNSDGTLSIDEDTLNSALESDASSVASTLQSLTDSVKTSSTSLISNALTNYTTSFQKTMSMYTELSKFESQSAFLGQLLDTSV